MLCDKNLIAVVGEKINLSDEWILGRRISSPKGQTIEDFIQHPIRPLNLLAITGQQLIEVDQDGNCTVVAGQPLANKHCLLQPNSVTFVSLKTINSANFSETSSWSKTLGSENTILLIDNVLDCLIAVDLENINETANCSSESLLAAEYGQETYGNYPIEFPTTKLVSTGLGQSDIHVMHYEGFIMLVIICRYISKQLVYTLYPSGYSAVQYELFAIKEFPVGLANSQRFMIVSKYDCNKCNISKIAENATDEIVFSVQAKYKCNRKKVVHPIFFQDHTFVIDANSWVEIIWPLNSSDYVIKHPVEIKLLKEASDPKAVHVTSDGIWFWKEFKFYFIQPLPSKPGPSGHVRFVKFGSGYCDGINIKSEKVDSLEICAYRCFKLAECNSFSSLQVSSNDVSCYYHGVTYTFTSEIQFDCYILVL